MIIEFPLDKLSKDALDLIYELRLLGIKPINAHAEENEYIYKIPTTISDFIEEEFLFQVNMGRL